MAQQEYLALNNDHVGVCHGSVGLKITATIEEFSEMERQQYVQ